MRGRGFRASPPGGRGPRGTRGPGAARGPRPMGPRRPHYAPPPPRGPRRPYRRPYGRPRRRYVGCCIPVLGVMAAIGAVIALIVVLV